MKRKLMLNELYIAQKLKVLKIILSSNVKQIKSQIHLY